MEWLPAAELLTFEEIERIARLFVEHFGIDSIRLTGGEPTVRAHLPILVAKLAAPAASTWRSPPTAPRCALIAARPGRRRPAAHQHLARLAAPPTASSSSPGATSSHRVLDGIDAAIEAGLDPVKINVVVMRGVNDDEFVDFARFGRDRGVDVRFIEFMPLDADGGWTRESGRAARPRSSPRIDAVLPARAGRAGPRAGRAVPLPRRSAARSASSPASPSRSATSCDRVRLTADGQFRTCLFAVDETDLRALLRGGATDDELAAPIERTVAAKWAGHEINKVHFIRPKRSMSQIGG